MTLISLQPTMDLFLCHPSSRSASFPSKCISTWSPFFLATVDLFCWACLSHLPPHIASSPKVQWMPIFYLGQFSGPWHKHIYISLFCSMVYWLQNCWLLSNDELVNFITVKLRNVALQYHLALCVLNKIIIILDCFQSFLYLFLFLWYDLI